jgi:hypothetical protein
MVAIVKRLEARALTVLARDCVAFARGGERGFIRGRASDGLARDLSRAVLEPRGALEAAVGEAERLGARFYVVGDRFKRYFSVGRPRRFHSRQPPMSERTRV